MEDLLDAVTVYTESGEELRLPKGSTVIDFAFKISAGSGKTLYKAKINNEDASIFSELHSGEKVEIFSYAKKDEDSKGLETVKIKWLNNVATDNARRQITKYLEEKLER
ncbi:MAG: TGS domain-containing protein [Ruminococcaceae bacterium]|nr:TGS domain-containing protein [Oscillospiraceae bacterium]